MGSGKPGFVGARAQIQTVRMPQPLNVYANLCCHLFFRALNDVSARASVDWGLLGTRPFLIVTIITIIAVSLSELRGVEGLLCANTLEVVPH